MVAGAAIIGAVLIAEGHAAGGVAVLVALGIIPELAVFVMWHSLAGETSRLWMSTYQR
jgi:hypothetical protein